MERWEDKAGSAGGSEPATGEYHIPPLELLSDVSNERIIDKKNIEESIAVLEDTFSSFGVKVKVNQVSCGPAVPLRIDTGCGGENKQDY